MVHGIDKPKFVDGKDTALQELLRSEPVRIVLFDGCRPGVNSDVWSCPGTSYLVWFHSASSHLVVLQGWLLECHALKHSELGGVTGGEFQCCIAWHRAAPSLKCWPTFFPPPPCCDVNALTTRNPLPSWHNTRVLFVERSCSGILYLSQQHYHFPSSRCLPLL